MRYAGGLALVVGVGILMTACSGGEEATTKPTTKMVTPTVTTKPLVVTTVTPATTPLVTTKPATATPTTTQAATKQAIDATKLDAQGYIRQWLLLAPIGFGEKYDAEQIEKEQIPGEATMTPKEGDKVKVASEEGEPGAFKTVQKELTWKPVVTEEDFIDFNAFLGLDTSDAMGAYAVAYLDVPEEMKGIKFSWSSNDNGLIYLNGKNVGKYVGGRSLSEDSDVADNLTLTKGVNVVVFKVWNDSNNWQGCVRLLTKDDKPVTNVKVRLTK